MRMRVRKQVGAQPQSTPPQSVYPSTSILKKPGTPRYLQLQHMCERLEESLQGMRFTMDTIQRELVLVKNKLRQEMETNQNIFNNGTSSKEDTSSPPHLPQHETQPTYPPLIYPYDTESGFRGVYKNHHSRKTWCVKVPDKSKQGSKHLGTFRCRLQAAKAYDQYMRLHDPHIEKFNFPEGVVLPMWCEDASCLRCYPKVMSVGDPATHRQTVQSGDVQKEAADVHDVKDSQQQVTAWNLGRVYFSRGELIRAIVSSKTPCVDARLIVRMFNKSGFLGVHWSGSNWKASVHHHGKVLLGSFMCKVDAACARDEYIKQHVNLHGIDQTLNFDDTKPLYCDDFLCRKCQKSKLPRFRVPRHKVLLGVRRGDRGAAWTATIFHPVWKQDVMLGNYRVSTDAAVVHDYAARFLYGDRARVNFDTCGKLVVRAHKRASEESTETPVASTAPSTAPSTSSSTAPPSSLSNIGVEEVIELDKLDAVDKSDEEEEYLSLHTDTESDEEMEDVAVNKKMPTPESADSKDDENIKEWRVFVEARPHLLYPHHMAPTIEDIGAQHAHLYSIFMTEDIKTRMGLSSMHPLEAAFLFNWAQRNDCMEHLTHFITSYLAYKAAHPMTMIRPMTQQCVEKTSSSNHHSRKAQSVTHLRAVHKWVVTCTFDVRFDIPRFLMTAERREVYEHNLRSMFHALHAYATWMSLPIQHEVLKRRMSTSPSKKQHTSRLVSLQDLYETFRKLVARKRSVIHVDFVLNRSKHTVDVKQPKHRT
jgi:hypothetical protein